MDLSGIIFVVLALAWAVYLIPKALKHHDEVARTRSVDRFSTAMRVLARREPVSRRDARLVVTPPRPAEATRMVVPSSTSRSASSAAASGTPAVEQATPRAGRSGEAAAAPRTAARVAARRRRRVLSLLLVADLVVVGLSAFAVLPWWSVSVPSLLVVGFLALCRRAVCRTRTDAWDRELADGGGDAEPVPTTADLLPRRAIRVDAPYGTARTVLAQETRNAQGFAEVSAHEETVAIPVAALRTGVIEEGTGAIGAAEVETVAVAVPTVDGGSLWDPLPVTLPTYVGKAKAARTVRTIDLGEPGTWTSGRTEADSRLVEEAQASAEEQATPAPEQQRAVGS